MEELQLLIRAIEWLRTVVPVQEPVVRWTLFAGVGLAMIFADQITAAVGKHLDIAPKKKDAGKADRCVVCLKDSTAAVSALHARLDGRMDRLEDLIRSETAETEEKQAAMAQTLATQLEVRALQLSNDHAHGDLKRLIEDLIDDVKRLLRRE